MIMKGCYILILNYVITPTKVREKFVNMMTIWHCDMVIILLRIQICEVFFRLLIYPMILVAFFF